MKKRRHGAGVTLPPVDNDFGPEVRMQVMLPPRGLRGVDGAPAPSRLATRWEADRLAAGGPGGRWRAGGTREVGARAREAALVEPVAGDANGRQYRRRLSALERMQRRGSLTPWQAAAGEALAVAWEATERSPSLDLAQDRVDASPRPDQRTMILIEAQDRYARLAKVVPVAAWPLVYRVACLGVALPRRDGRQARRALELLRLGLDALALHLGVRA